MYLLWDEEDTRFSAGADSTRERDLLPERGEHGEEGLRCGGIWVCRRGALEEDQAGCR